ncbi:MAG: hypothetical protein ACEPOW_03830 [Bacteroidales bacterium]
MKPIKVSFILLALAALISTSCVKDDDTNIIQLDHAIKEISYDKQRVATFAYDNQERLKEFYLDGKKLQEAFGRSLFQNARSFKVYYANNDKIANVKAIQSLEGNSTSDSLFFEYKNELVNVFIYKKNTQGKYEKKQRLELKKDISNTIISTITFEINGDKESAIYTENYSYVGGNLLRYESIPADNNKVIYEYSYLQIKNAFKDFNILSNIFRMPELSSILNIGQVGITDTKENKKSTYNFEYTDDSGKYPLTAKIKNSDDEKYEKEIVYTYY